MDKEKLRRLGVDYELAIKRFAGNEELYERYLNKFQEDTHLQEADAALERQEYQTVLEQIHAFKGITGSLGMDELYAKAQILVSSIRANQLGHCKDQLLDVHTEYDKIMEYYS